MAEGEKCVGELAGIFRGEALIATSQWYAENDRTGVKQNFENVYVAHSDQMARISTMSTPPSVIAIFTIPALTPIESKLANGLYIALDGVRDPGNLGTIIRTADWFGISHIFASADTVDVFNSKTVQSTMGSLARVSVQYTDLPKLFADNKHLPVYGTLLDGKNIYTAPLSASGFIVMGNEGSGLSASVRECVDVPLLLPPFPCKGLHAESLNVAIATALVTAEFRRRQLYTNPCNK